MADISNDKWINIEEDASNALVGIQPTFVIGLEKIKASLLTRQESNGSSNAPNQTSGSQAEKAQWNKGRQATTMNKTRMEIKEGYGCEEI